VPPPPPQPPAITFKFLGIPSAAEAAYRASEENETTFVAKVARSSEGLPRR